MGGGSASKPAGRQPQGWSAAPASGRCTPRPARPCRPKQWCSRQGVASAGLLEPLDHFLPLEPVLGQALELELPPGTHWGPSPAWPGAVVWQGLNLVPRPPSQAKSERLWLGATLEPGCRADPDALAALRELGGAAPTWLRQAKLVRHWQGHRPHPIGRPAPLLEQLEPGLVLASGHYRNGLLMAPATAEWVAQQLEAPS